MIVVVGLSHRSAPIAIREKHALGSDEVAGAARRLLEAGPFREVAILCTCNRVEIIGACEPAEAGRAEAEARAFFSARDTGPQHLYARAGDEALSHLFRVSASLDSLVLGEPQILGQVKDAFELAARHGTSGPELTRAATDAFRCAKRVRRETVLGSGKVSVPSVAIDLARQIFGDLAGKKAALVGTGAMGRTVAELLAREGASLTVVGRNAEHAEQVAEDVGAESRSLADVGEALAGVDVVVTSTSARHYVLTHGLIAGLRRARRGRSLFIIDLAVPRDVEPSVQSLDGVFLYNVDDFARIVGETQDVREREAAEAERLVSEELERVGRRSEAGVVTPVIVALRERVRGVLHAELERSLRGRLQHLGAPEREALDAMLEAATNKLLHRPSERLRDAALATDAALGGDLLVAALDDLFDLKHSPSLPSGAPPREGARARRASLGDAERDAASGPPAAGSTETMREQQNAERGR